MYVIYNSDHIHHLMNESQMQSFFQLSNETFVQNYNFYVANETVKAVIELVTNLFNFSFLFNFNYIFFVCDRMKLK